MTFAQFLADISFRFAGPRVARNPDGWYVLKRKGGSCARWLALPGIPLDHLNAVLPQGESQIRSRLRPLCCIPKMSTFAIGAIIHQAVARMPADHAFVNVGVWNGFTLLSAMAGNADRRCVGIDNFSQFAGPRQEFMARFMSRRSPRHEFHDLDYAEYFAKVHQGPIGVYIYDGEHSYSNQLQGLQTAEPHFSEDCVIVVDDTNWIEPWRATMDFISQSRHGYRFLLDQTTCENGHPSFWNGLMILQRTERKERSSNQIISSSESRRTETAEPRPPAIDWNAALALEQQTPMPLVSLIIVHHRAEADLEAAIAAALRLRYPRVEIILADLVSSDSSRKIIAEGGDRVVPISQGSSADLSVAFQAGLDASHGDLVSFFDSEQALVPDAIEKGLIFGRDHLGRMHVLDKWHENIVRPILELLRIVPPGQSFILVDEQQWEISGMVAGRRVLPFMEQAGQYAGLPPDNPTAIRELERMRKQLTAGFIAFAQPAFWWLDCYRTFGEFLRGNCRCVLQNERLIVFDLQNLA